MNALAKPIVFAGPSLFPLTNYSERWDVEFFPPVARDGINRIVRNIARPGTLVIADGVFHASLLDMRRLGMQSTLAGKCTECRQWELLEQQR